MQCKHLWQCWQTLPGNRFGDALPLKYAAIGVSAKILIDKLAAAFTCHKFNTKNKIMEETGTLSYFLKCPVSNCRQKSIFPTWAQNKSPAMPQGLLVIFMYFTWPL